MKLRNLLITILFANTIFVFAQLETSIVANGEAYARGSIVEIGINNQGVFGAQNSLKPVGYHDNRAGTLFGFIANPLNDGWVDYDGDFFTPGFAEEGFSLEINGVNYHNNNHNTKEEIPGAITSATIVPDPCFADYAQIVWEGSVQGINVKRTYSITEDGLFIQMITSLENTNPVAVSDVYWMHNIDPDNNKTLSGIYETTNTIISQPTSTTDNIAIVSGNQDPSGSLDMDGSSVSFYAKNEAARVTIGGFDNDIASEVWNGISPLSANVNDSLNDDISMSIAFKFDDILPGETKTFRYFYFTVEIDESIIPYIPFINGVNPSSCGNDDGSLEYTGLNPNTDYEITYDDDGVTIGPTNYLSDASGQISIVGLDAGDYDNFIISSGVCISTPTESSVTLYNPLDANAGTDNVVELCGEDAVINLFDQLGGNPNLGGVWTPNLASGTGVFDSLVDPIGTYTYTVTIPDCGTSSADIVITSSNLTIQPTHYIHTECDDSVITDGVKSFDLMDLVVPNMISSLNGLTIKFFETADITTSPYTVDITTEIITPSNYQNNSNPQNIYVQFIDDSTGCFVVRILTLRVLPNPTPLEQVNIENMTSCINDGNGPGNLQNGYALFDFTDQAIAIQGVEQGVTLSFHTSEADANADIFEITDIANFYNSIPFDQTIWVRDENNVTGCFTLVHFEIDVPVPNMTISSTSDVLCIDENGVPASNTALPVISIATTSGVLSDYTFQWYLNDVIIPGEIGNSITVTQAGVYNVVMNHIQDINTDYDDTLCFSMRSATITISAEPDNFNANVTTNAFVNNHQIIATATTSLAGVIFTYTLDSLEQNTTGIFDNVAPGSHIISITDGEGCWIKNIDLFVIDYPKFFTPNGDGINDYWAINGQQGIPISQIFIFDRFGKLLKQLDPDSLGWDGTYNGNSMPATDYWFKIIYIEGPVGTATQKEFRAHFALKR